MKAKRIEGEMLSSIIEEELQWRNRQIEELIKTREEVQCQARHVSLGDVIMTKENQRGLVTSLHQNWIKVNINSHIDHLSNQEEVRVVGQVEIKEIEKIINCSQQEALKKFADKLGKWRAKLNRKNLPLSEHGGAPHWISIEENETEAIIQTPVMANLEEQSLYKVKEQSLIELLKAAGAKVVPAGTLAAEIRKNLPHRQKLQELLESNNIELNSCEQPRRKWGKDLKPGDVIEHKGLMILKEVNQKDFTGKVLETRRLETFPLETQVVFLGRGKPSEPKYNKKEIYQLDILHWQKNSESNHDIQGRGQGENEAIIMRCEPLPGSPLSRLSQEPFWIVSACRKGRTSNISVIGNKEEILKLYKLLR